MSECGVYIIRNTKSGRIYVGGSWDIHMRWKTHIFALRSGKHRRTNLQEDWNAYGEDAFSFELQETTSPVNLGDREGHWLRFYSQQPGGIYNVKMKTVRRALPEDWNRAMSNNLLKNSEARKALTLLRDLGFTGHQIAEAYLLMDSEALDHHREDAA